MARPTDIQPTIVVDSREQDPLQFTRFKVVEGSLVSGDYSIAGLTELFAVERKSIPDLVGCCMGSNRERFARECHRLRGFNFKRLVIVGTQAEILASNYRSAIKPQAVLGTLRTFEVRYNLPVLFCPTPLAAAREIETWIYYFTREVLNAAGEVWHTITEEARVA